MTEWIKYTGEPEQIDAMLTAEHGFIVDSPYSTFSHITTLKMPADRDNQIWLRALLHNGEVKFYLICRPHQLVDMICQQARTGQPVWIRFIDTDANKMIEYETFTPDWRIPGAQYSFEEFK